MNDTERMYFEINRNGHKTLYGPFASKQEARIASYFARSLDEHSKWLNSRAKHVVFSYSTYTDHEIESIKADPAGVELKSIKVVAKAPIHKSWKALITEYGKQSVDEIMSENYARVFGSKPE